MKKLQKLKLYWDSLFTETPLIYTSKGNLPIDLLTYKYWWVDGEEQTEFHEQYLLGSEIVKENAHIMKRKLGVSLDSVIGTLG